MQNKITQMLVILFQMALLLGGWDAAQAVTPMVAAGGTLGDHSSCAVDTNSVLRCWGSDSNGQLGLGTLLNSNVPLMVGSGFMTSPSNPGQTVISGGDGYTVAFKKDGSLWAWGYNDWGQFGDGTQTGSSTPKQIGTGFTSVTAGRHTTFAIKSDGSLWAWGRNSQGQLGDGTKTDSPTPKQIGTGFTSVVVAPDPYIATTFAIKSDGSLWAWGSNWYGQLGDGTSTESLTPKQVGTGFASVISTGFSTFALTTDGSLWAWGTNSNGQLGDGTKTDSLTPKQIGTGFMTVASYAGRTVAIKSDGSLWAWGATNLESGATNWSLIPKQIGTGFISLAGGSTNFAIKSDGSLWAWGENSSGQLGDGTKTRILTPKQIGTGFKKVIEEGAGSTFALKTDGSLWAWGSNDVGQLGDGTTTDSLTPKQVGTDFETITITEPKYTIGFERPYRSFFAVKRDGSLWAWGSNGDGRLGVGTVTNRLIPTQVGVGFKTVAVAGGFDGLGAGHYIYTLAVKVDGSLWAWGRNDFGQLGDGTRTNIAAPKQVGIGFKTVAASGKRTFALKSDGSLWKWGLTPTQIGTDFGAVAAGLALKTDGSLWALGLGDGTTTPKQIGTGFSAAAPGRDHIVALKSDGSLWTWGDNQYGQLGDGTTTGSLTPKQIGTGFSTVAAGDFSSFAVKSDGSLWAWGDNMTGQLGDGTVLSSSTPKQVGTGFSSVASISNYSFHTVAIKLDGTVWAWGNNRSGQLGDATVASRLTPVLTTNETANGPLDLIPESPNNIPSELIPPYWLQVTKAADVSTAITYNSDDLNKEGSVYVVAYLDPASPLLAGASEGTGGGGAGDGMRRAVKAAAAPRAPVPAVLTRGGWKQMNSATPTEALYSGPLIPSKSTFAMYEASKFDNTKDNGLFCVAYAGASANSSKGLIRSVVSGVDDSLNQCPPLVVGISTTLSECFFNWAERSFPQYFAPAAASATVSPYYYRYYSGTGNYLATNSADHHVWALGKDTAGNPLDLGPLSNYSGTAGCQ